MSEIEKVQRQLQEALLRYASVPGALFCDLRSMPDGWSYGNDVDRNLLTELHGRTDPPAEEACEHCGYEHPEGGEARWHKRDNGELILVCSEPQSDLPSEADARRTEEEGIEPCWACEGRGSSVHAYNANCTQPDPPAEEAKDDENLRFHSDARRTEEER